MKRTSRYLAALVPLLLASLAQAKDLPNVNVYYDAKPAATPSVPAKATPAVVASTDAASGRPTFLWGLRGASVASPALGSTPETAARFHLMSHADRYGLTPAALSTAELKEVHDTGRGGILVSFTQRVAGVSLFHHDVKVMMDRSLGLVAIGGSLHPAAVPRPKVHAFSVSEVKAIATALKDLTGIVFQPTDLVDTKKSKAEYHYYDLAATPLVKASKIHLTRSSRVKKVYFPLPDRLVPAYYLEVAAAAAPRGESDSYGYVVAADDGRVLYRENHKQNEAFKYRVWADPAGDLRPTDGPLVDFTPHPTGVPDGVYPGFAAPILVTMDGFNKNPNNTFDPWLPKGATQTLGNNVDAYTDDDTPEGFSGGSDIRADITGPNTFDRVFDTSQAPTVSDNQRKASITQIFYVTNWLHDWWYDSGFNEVAGNAQQDNLGRGGVGGDVLFAQAQDGFPDPNSRNNANMDTPADGESPTMQMYVWDGVSGVSSVVVPSINKTYTPGTASFGLQSFDLTGTVILGQDGTAPVNDGCQNITTNITGKIVLLDRGMCTFQQKAQAAAAGGAIGLIIANNVQGAAPQMPGDGSADVSIPVVSITQAQGTAIKTALQSGPITTTIHRDFSPDRDGTIDNNIVSHEWGHYIHHRLVACGSNQCGAQSEGWGDFNASLLTLRAGDNLNGVYPAAQYAMAAFPDAGYFGIRRYPYSTDMTKDPLTFKNITSGEPLPAGPPNADNGIDNSEQHNAGEVWATMMFEAYVSLLQKTVGATPSYTFAEARRRMSDYVVAGMKLAPTDPTYTEMRDAVLAAAAAADTADFDALALAFAKRGAGSCAVSPARDSDDFVGVVESYTVNPNVQALSVKVDDSVVSCDKDGILDAGEAGKITVELMNAGPAAMSETTVSVVSMAAGVTFPNGTTIKVPALGAYAKTTAQIDVVLDDTITAKANLDLTVTVANPDGCMTSSTITTAPWINVDKAPMSSTLDDVESETTSFTTTGTNVDKIWTRVEATPGNHAWHGLDFGSPSDTALESTSFDVSLTDPLILSFDHRYQFESGQGTNFDGGVIEVSTNNGATWQDISTFGAPGYTGQIGDFQGDATNALKGRQGFVDQSASWPATDKVTVNMAKALAGQKVKFRFRIGTDEAAGMYGWEIDNISLQGVTGTPFDALVVDATTCAETTTSSGSTTVSTSVTSGGPTTTSSTSTGGVGGAPNTTSSIASSGAGGDTGNGGAGGSGGDVPLDGRGCGCYVGDQPSSPLYAAPLFLLSALLIRRRRR